MKVCMSCNTEVSGTYLEFKCPKCLKSNIIRCEHCRVMSKEYKCINCGFEGP